MAHYMCTISGLGGLMLIFFQGGKNPYCLHQLVTLRRSSIFVSEETTIPEGIWRWGRAVLMKKCSFKQMTSQFCYQALTWEISGHTLCRNKSKIMSPTVNFDPMFSATSFWKKFIRQKKKLHVTFKILCIKDWSSLKRTKRYRAYDLSSFWVLMRLRLFPSQLFLLYWNVSIDLRL